VTLPACFVKTIREEFPSPDGNYKGFRVCMWKWYIRFWLV
jgi:hypothetical protein